MVDYQNLAFDPVKDIMGLFYLLVRQLLADERFYSVVVDLCFLLSLQAVFMPKD